MTPMTFPLRQLVLDSQLKGPVQLAFDPDAWDRAFASLKDSSPDDERLYRAALFFGQHLRGLRQELDAYPMPAGSGVRQCRWSVGFVNREFLVAMEKLSVESAMRYDRFEDFISQRLALASGNAPTLTEFIELLPDALRFELSVIKDGRAGKATQLSSTQEVDRVSLRMNLAAAYHIFEEQWQDCLHHGWQVREPAEAPGQILPGDTNRVIALSLADTRQQHLDQQHTELGSRFIGSNVELAGLAKRGSGKNKQYVTQLANRLVATQVALSRLSAVEPDLAPFLNVPLDRLDGLTVNELLAVWTALVPLAHDIVARMPVNGHIRSLGQVEQFAPIETEAEVLRALGTCTGLTQEVCRKALTVFYWRDVRDSVWHRPLVPLPDGRGFLIVLPALIMPNLRRSVEYWLRIGGVDLAERGDAYEDYVRRELKKAIEQNALIQASARVLPNSVSPPDKAIGDIDVALIVGSSILIAEVKCLFRPGGAHERFLFESKIEEAADQVMRKRDFLVVNPKYVDSIFPEIAGRERTIIACVVTNSAIGTMKTVHDVPIVDMFILERYLRDGYGAINVKGLDESTGERIDFYLTIDEAARNLSGYLLDPPHLRRYREAVRMETFKQISFAPPHREIHWIHPRVYELLAPADQQPGTANTS